MARTIHYTYKKQQKTLLFSYEKFHDIHEAVAEADTKDLTEYLSMVKQLKQVSDTKAIRDYRDNYFKRLGFSEIKLAPKEQRGIGEK